MNFSYYPGCTLKTKAKELDKCARRAAEALDVRLEELENWQCCGAVYPLARDEVGTRLSAVRALSAAYAAGQKLVTVCSACHHVIKRVNNDMKNDPEIRDKVNAYIAPDAPYAGEATVIHYLEMLRDEVGFDNIKSKLAAPLKERKIHAYYGCLLLRPSDVMAFDDPENPSIMEKLTAALGATPVETAYRNECCGGFVALSNPALAAKKAAAVVDAAIEAGADTIMTACPLCKYNLDKAAGGRIGVYYFAELLCQALGLSCGEGKA